MDPFELYTSKEAIYHETGFTRSQSQGYYKLIDNIQKLGNMISKSKQELKRVISQNYQISDPPQEEKS